MTSRTVFTIVPVAARGCSQSRNALNVAWVTLASSQPLQMSWKTTGTQPPPLFSAWVMKPCRSWRVNAPAFQPVVLSR